MYEVSIKKSFSAAHALNIGGKCEDLHGHNFAVEVTVTAERLNDEGLVIDFRTLKGKMEKILELLDHKFLNEINYFRTNGPTSERIARFIFDTLSQSLASTSATLSAVTVWESENARATYRGQ